MHFGDERYVRLYTRDTLTWLSLGWEGQAALALLMRKVDRAGVLEIDDRTAEEALAAVTGLPTDICTTAWSRLSGGKEPTVTLRDETSRALVIPRFLDAQEAKASDKARQQKLRETRRAVTPRDASSQAVTKRHVRSQPVTPSCAVLSCAVEDLDHERTVDPAAPAPKASPKSSEPGPDPWPADLLEQLRIPLKRGLPLADNDWADCIRATAAQWPLQRRVNAARVLLERAETGKTFGLSYLVTLIREGAEPRAPRSRNGNGERVWTEDEKEAARRRLQPAYIPEKHETADEHNARLLRAAEAEVNAQKGRA